MIITGDYPPLPMLIELADREKIPLLKTPFATTKFIHLFTLYLDDFFASRTSVHGSLVDVYGISTLNRGVQWKILMNHWWLLQFFNNISNLI